MFLIIFDKLHLSTFLYVYRGSWSSKSNNLNQWIQAEFATPFKISAIQTQGRDNHNNQWVQSFKLSFGNDGANWSDVNDKDGAEMVKIQKKIFPDMNDNIDQK